jgi:hypothetical protein
MSTKRPTVSTKRKSRAQIMKNYWKRVRLGSQTKNLNNSVQTFEEDTDMSSLKYDLSDDEVFISEREEVAISQTNNFAISGRRIVDINHLLSSLKKIRYDPYGCTFYNVDIIKERGLESIFTYKCNMCGIIDTFSTENSNSQNYCHINNAGVCGAIAVGVGFSQKTEFYSALDIPNMSQNKYNKCESAVIDKIEELAHEEMIEAGREEYNLAIEAGEVESDGVPYCILNLVVGRKILLHIMND